jgi:hypothetical protein
MLQWASGASAWPPGRRCDAPQCEALALLINAADEQRHALRHQPSRGHDQLSFDDRLADVLDCGDGFALPFTAEVNHRATTANRHRWRVKPGAR